MTVVTLSSSQRVNYQFPVWHRHSIHDQMLWPTWGHEKHDGDILRPFPGLRDQPRVFQGKQLNFSVFTLDDEVELHPVAAVVVYIVIVVADWALFYRECKKLYIHSSVLKSFVFTLNGEKTKTGGNLTLKIQFAAQTQIGFIGLFPHGSCSNIIMQVELWVTEYNYTLMSQVTFYHMKESFLLFLEAGIWKLQITLWRLEQLITKVSNIICPTGGNIELYFKNQIWIL